MVDKKYQEYTSSKLIWVKDYPAHWDLTRVKYEAYVKARVGWHGLTSNDFTDVGPYLVTGSDFKGSTIKWEDCYHCDLKRYEQDPYIQLKNGDLLLTKDGTIGKVALVDGLKDDDKATLNSGVFVVRPLSNNFTTRFYYWLLESRVFKDFVDYYASGSTIIHLYQATFVNFSYASPPIDEQEKIASFLDHETAKIDTLIEKQKRLIELLTEKRQAVISHAVTKGLNPDVPMKDSGVEWLGEVPEHWNITKIKYIAELTPSKSEALSHLGGKCSFVPMEKLKRDSLILDETRDVKDVHQGYTYFKDNDILLAKVTPCFENQNIAVAKNLVNGIGFGSSEIFVLRSNNIKLNYFMFYRLQENIFMQMGVGAMTGAGGLQRVPTDFINNFQFALPPLKEAQQIVNYLRDQNKRFDILTSKANQQIQLMQERRTALISAAVTGKIDVRDWVKPE